MQIDWWTLALQAVNFLLLVWLLWRFLYRPVREIIEKRKALAGRAFADADRREGAADAARRQFEEARGQLAEERQEMLRKIHDELEAERRKIMAEAKGEAEELLDAARDAIATEREAALKEVREEVAALAVELAFDLLQKVETTACGAIFLEQLEKQFLALPEEERDRLSKDLAAGEARLTVVTASPLAPEERARWIERLSASLGHGDRIDFASEPEILGGAELRFPHAVFRFTWADQLQQAKEMLQADDAAS